MVLRKRLDTLCKVLEVWRKLSFNETSNWPILDKVVVNQLDLIDFFERDSTSFHACKVALKDIVLDIGCILIQVVELSRIKEICNGVYRTCWIVIPVLVIASISSCLVSFG